MADNSTKDAASKGAAGSSTTTGRYEVKLRVYDLSGGMARQMSMAILGKQVDGIWHTGILVHGREFFYGGGIQALPPASVEASFGIRPVQEITLGHTNIEHSTLLEFLRGISPRFTQMTYNLFTNNCNNFSNEVSQFLLGRGIPEHIINLPQEVLATPLGRMLEPMVTQMQNSMYASTAGQATDPFSMLGAALGSAPAPSAVAAPAPAPAPAPAAVAPLPASKVLATHNRALISADTSVLKIVVDRLVKRKAVAAGEEEAVVRAGVARLVAGSGAGSGGAGSGAGSGGGEDDGTSSGKREEGEAELSNFTRILARIMIATDKTAGPALCLLRSAVLDQALLRELIAEGAALRTVITNLASKKYTTVTPRLMALAALSNLIATEEGVAFLEGEALSQAIDSGLLALSDERVQVRQLGAAVLHNAALRLPCDGESLSDEMVQVLCALIDGVSNEKDKETGRRRLLGVGVLVKRAGMAATSLMEALESLDALQAVTTTSTCEDEVRQLAAEVIEVVRAV